MKSKASLKKLLFALIAFCLLAPAACKPLPAGAAVAAAADLKDLQNLEQLKTHFNRDQGMPRLVLLLSPT